MGGCPICAKHLDLSAVPGGALMEDEHAVVVHAPSDYLGYLMVEPRRHVAELGDLTPDEAASMGRLAARASAALRDQGGAEHVYAAVIGHGVDHLHLHLIPRYPNSPREYWWTRVDEWPDAPRGGAQAVTALVARLRQALGPAA
jgi:histidine triad (HIT) family protein